MLSTRGWAGCGLLVLLLLLAIQGSCSRGGGGGGPGPGPGPVTPRDWGPIPVGLRGPGAVQLGLHAQIEIQNPGPARSETVRASVPFSWGDITDPTQFSIEGLPTAWLVLQRWPDRSVRMAQAQWVENLPAGATIRRRLKPQPTSLTGPFTPNPMFASGLPELRSEVQDPFGAVYTTRLVGDGDVVQETPLVRVRRFRHHHYAAAGGIGRDYLSATFYVTEFRDQPLVLVDWLIGNDYLGADDPAGSQNPDHYALGGVDIDSARFAARGFDLVVPYRPQEEGIGSGVLGAGGFTRFEVMQNTWIADGQMRRYRFLLLRDDPLQNASAQLAARTSATAMMEQPLHPLADHGTLRATHALGLLGGPGPAPANAQLRATEDFNGWVNGNHFGTWGTHGDAAMSAQTGTPRNHPLTPEAAHAVQARDPRLVTILEQKAWTQAVRPYHLHGLVVENTDEIFLWDGVPLYPGSRDLSVESLGRRALRQDDPWPNYRSRVRGGPNHAHGFTPYDIEHWSMDLVFDYWALTGDAWAQDELRQLGENLRGLLRPDGFFTSDLQEARSEGWVMQGLVQAFLATDDLRYRDAALDRLHDIVAPDRGGHDASRAIKVNGSDPRTGWPQPHGFYMPWQHGAMLFGYLAAWKHFGDPLFLTICDEITRCVEYGWVRNVTQPPFGFVEHGLRFYVPTEHDNVAVPADHFDAAFGIRFGDSPLGGAHQILLAGLLMHAEVTTDMAAQSRALRYGELLLQLPLDDHDRWNKWFYCLPIDWNR
ncbi:MAG: hypothetical protein NXI31_14680 [bacterium]|nr:hypothetical protein [bacterium]